MSKRVLAALAVALAVVAGSPAFSAPRNVTHVVDPQGDANGINSQGITPLRAVDGLTPKLGVQMDSLDILNVKFASEIVNRKPTAILVTLNLNASPTTETHPRKYTVFFNTGDCLATHSLEWHFTPQTAGVPDAVGVPGVAGVGVWTRGAQFNRGNCFDDEKRGIMLTTSKVSGKTLTWRIPIGEVGKAGTLIKKISVETRLRPRSSGETTWPLWDYATSTKTYAIGS